MLDIVMYHYVRNNEDHQYDTYSRSESEFERQVSFFLDYSEVVHPADHEKISYYLGNADKQAFLLTFDDGYKDHLFCAEFLNSKSLSGIFFVPSRITSGELLDVNAIHRIIGHRGIGSSDILALLVAHPILSDVPIRLNGSLVSAAYYLNHQFEPQRFDDNETLIVKRLLQRDIDDGSARKLLVEYLLEEICSTTPHELAKELYLSSSEMKLMVGHGMLFGSHGKTHRWLNTLTDSDQLDELESSFQFLEALELTQENNHRLICYPYGAYNSATIEICKRLYCSYGFTTQVGSAFATTHSDRLTLKRWDTNDFWDIKWRKPTCPYSVENVM